MSAITTDFGQVARARSSRAVRSATSSSVRAAGHGRPRILNQGGPATSSRHAPSPLQRPPAAACRVQAPARGTRPSAAVVRPRATLDDRALLAIMVGFGALLLVTFAVVIQGFWAIGAGLI
ncbi:hypothetical protein M3G03_05965 [Aestuariimicrobium sp. p3-SID1156]|uniref:hypothetical protein n=1 Tax=Aestuariimicrobium sp. p3-SID1156 TaxID=2916038 RepID=UPI00223C2C16|nr:hypothetical protein [Aestuariimicrobium sp. p3-SID1156]MCT1459087.1 hypothetical protein [Aestuariimicrobium sp. p3-SID1156]